MGRGGKKSHQLQSSSALHARVLDQKSIAKIDSADPAWWEKFAEENPYLIHVTHSAAIDRIKKDGIVPSQAPLSHSPGSNWDIQETTTLSSRPGHSYFAIPGKLEDIEAYYDPAYLTGDEYVDEEEFRRNNPQYDDLYVVLVSTKDLDPILVSADEDSLNDTFRVSEAYPRHPEDIDLEREIEGWDEMSADEQEEAFQGLLDKMKPLGQWAEEEMADHLSDPDVVRDDVEERGTLAYGGYVPPESILKVVSLQEAKKLFRENQPG